MQTPSIPYQPIGGINNDDNPRTLDTQVTDSYNFLFERGMCVSRPGLLSKGAASLIVNPLIFATLARESLITFVVDKNSNIYHVSTISPFFALSPAYTGPSLTGTVDTAGVMNAVPFLSLLLMGNNINGMIRIVPSSLTYTQVTDAPFRYFTTIYSRVVGAVKYPVGNQGSQNRRTIGYSASGDETNWTTSDSGSLMLSDTSDDITGLGVMRNVLVIFRQSGIHLGYVTGSAIPVFNIQNWNKIGAGVFYPDSLVVRDNVAFFCSYDDVWMFDLQNLTPIGRPIRRDLFGYLQQGVRYRGVLSRGQSDNNNRIRYILSPTPSPDGTLNFTGQYAPIFVYDMLEDKWSKHLYQNVGTHMTSEFIDIGVTKFGIIDGNPNPTLYLWDANTPCESVASLTGKLVQIGEINKDYRVKRVLLSHRCKSPTTGTLNLSATLNDQVNLGSNIQSLGTAAPDSRWERQIFNLDVTGQNFGVNLVMPSNTHIELDQFALLYSESGEFKGVNT